MRSIAFVCSWLAISTSLWAEGDTLKKFDGSAVVGNLLEVREGSVVLKPEGSGDDGRLEVPFSDLESIRFRHTDDRAQLRKVLFDTRGDTDRKAEKTATIKLRAGKQRFGLTFLHKTGPSLCKLEYSGPGVNRTKLSPTSLFRAGLQATYTQRDKGFDAEGFLLPEVFTPEEKGVFARVHEFSAEAVVEDYSDFKGIRVARYAAANSVDLGAFKHSNNHFAVVLHGFLTVPTDGEYNFYLNASQDVLVWFGNDPPAVHPGSPTLQGSDFTVIAADSGTWWGPLTAWGPDSLTITTSIAGTSHPIEAAVTHLQEIWSTPVILKETKVDRAGEPTDKDSVYVKSADGKTVQRVAGKVLGKEGDSLQVEYEGEKRGLKMERIVGVVFQGRRTKDPPAPGVLVVSGGHRLPGTMVSGKRGTPLGFKAAWGQAIEWPYDRIVRFEVRNGRNVWLTDLQPTAQESIPYFDRNLGWSADKSLRGGELKITDKSYPRGLCTNSRTVLAYNIEGYKRFESDLGVQHEDGRLGRAAVKVLVDGQVAFENADVKLESGPLPVSVDLAGKKSLTLEVDFGENFDVGDHITWGGAKLIK